MDQGTFFDIFPSGGVLRGNPMILDETMSKMSKPGRVTTLSKHPNFVVLAFFNRPHPYVFHYYLKFIIKAP